MWLWWTGIQSHASNYVLWHNKSFLILIRGQSSRMINILGTRICCICRITAPCSPVRKDWICSVILYFEELTLQLIGFVRGNGSGALPWARPPQSVQPCLPSPACAGSRSCTRCFAKGGWLTRGQPRTGTETWPGAIVLARAAAESQVSKCSISTCAETFKATGGYVLRWELHSRSGGIHVQKRIKSLSFSKKMWIFITHTGQ